MNQKIKKRKYCLILTLVTLISGIGGGLLLRYVWPEYYFSSYPFIPVYFYVFGFIFIYLFERVRKNIQQRTLILYASLRMMKLMVSIVVLVLYGLLIRNQIKEFLVTFIVFYIIYLIFETLFFFNFENKEAKRLKAEKIMEK